MGTPYVIERHKYSETKINIDNEIFTSHCRENNVTGYKSSSFYQTTQFKQHSNRNQAMESMKKVLKHTKEAMRIEKLA